HTRFSRDWSSDVCSSDLPPAILVTPEDALASVRSAIMLGAVVPSLRKETEALVADLTELSRIAASIEDERERLKEAFSQQLEEKIGRASCRERGEEQVGA